MKHGNKVVLGIYSSRELVENAVDTLKNAGFRNYDISVLMPEFGDTRTFAHEKHTKAPEGAAIGTSTGAVVGGVLGWLVGAGTVALAPALAPFVAAGPIMSMLAGASMGGAVGGISGALIGLGFPEYEAVRYEEFVKDGGMLLSVHVDDTAWLDKATEILKATGANDISSTTEEEGYRSHIPESEGYRVNQVPPNDASMITPFPF